MHTSPRCTSPSSDNAAMAVLVDGRTRERYAAVIYSVYSEARARVCVCVCLCAVPPWSEGPQGVAGHRVTQGLSLLIGTNMCTFGFRYWRDCLSSHSTLGTSRRTHMCTHIYTHTTKTQTKKHVLLVLAPEQRRAHESVCGLAQSTLLLLMAWTASVPMVLCSMCCLLLPAMLARVVLACCLLSQGPDP